MVYEYFNMRFQYKDCYFFVTMLQVCYKSYRGVKYD